MDLKNKKVLLVGLGILGGGEALAKFLLFTKKSIVKNYFLNWRDLIFL